MAETERLFTDVDPETEEGKAIAWAVSVGLFKGHTDGTFRPNDPLTRGQAALLEQRRAENLSALMNYHFGVLREAAMAAVVKVGDWERYPLKGYGSGSGVTVHPEGWVVTNHHVVKDYLARGRTGQLIAEWGAGPRLVQTTLMNLEVVDEDPDNDLALLRLTPSPLQDGPPFPWLRLASTEEVPGEAVVVMGAPLGYNAWEAHGVVAREEETVLYYKRAQSLICVSAAVNPGNSGGALIRASDGTLLGIPAVKPAKDHVDGMAWAIHWRDVKRLLERNGIQQPE